MSNFQIKNSCDHPIRFTVIKGDQKYDVIMYTDETRVMPELASSRIDFAFVADVNLRIKKPIFQKVSLIAKIVKSEQAKVKSVELPDTFVMLKVKKSMEDADFQNLNKVEEVKAVAVQ